MPYIAGIALDILFLLFFFIAVYYLLLGIFSFFPERQGKKEYREFTFAVLIPAHNEAGVLSGLLTSIRNAEYPQEKIGVFVIADRCTDQTAAIARRFGACVVERTGGCDGKGAALRYACERLNEQLNQYQLITVLDADNVVDCRYFIELSWMHSQGHSAVQGYVDVKNPYASWVSLAHALWYWIPNRLQRMGRQNLGRGVTLQGTGFSVAATLFLPILQQETGMAEDAEYTLELAAQGYSVSYAKEAVVYDEKPENFWTSVRQRVRWVQGLRQAQKKFDTSVLKKRGLAEKPALWGDGTSTFVFCLFLGVWIGATLFRMDIVQFQFLQLWAYSLNYIFLNLYIFGSVLIAFFGLWIDKKMNYKIILNIFGYILYILSWIPAFFIGIFRQNKNNWYHTEHHSRCGENWRI